MYSTTERGGPRVLTARVRRVRQANTRLASCWSFSLPNTIIGHYSLAVILFTREPRTCSLSASSPKPCVFQSVRDEPFHVSLTETKRDRRREWEKERERERERESGFIAYLWLSRFMTVRIFLTACFNCEPRRRNNLSHSRRPSNTQRALRITFFVRGRPFVSYP